MLTHRAAAESHVAIIDRNGGAKSVATRLETADHAVRENTVACWVTRNSIPRPYWRLFEALGMATEVELECAYERRRALRAETRRQAQEGER